MPVGCLIRTARAEEDLKDKKALVPNQAMGASAFVFFIRESFTRGASITIAEILPVC
jgi:hypothetical protein